MLKVPFYSLQPQHEELKTEIMESIARVYERGSFVMGDELSLFEKEYAKFLGVEHCAGVGNGLDALILCLRAMDIGPGDEVIVPSHTYIATWLAVSAVGATIVPVDPDPDTYTLDPRKVQAAISSNTRAIIPVHLYGQSCDMDALMKLAGKNLFVIEDNAQAHGATFRDRVTGSIGHCNAHSFYPVKNIGALGDGGAVTTASRELDVTVRTLRNHGALERPHHELVGINSRLDEIQAAVLRVKLKHLGRITAQRRAIASEYMSMLSGVGDLTLPVVAPHCGHVYHLFVLRTSQRDALASFLKTKGIETLIHYPIPPHKQPAYSSLKFSKNEFPIAEQISATCLSLPLLAWYATGSDALGL